MKKTSIANQNMSSMNMRCCCMTVYNHTVDFCVRYEA